jgi:MFS transporter, MHS family, proline/betaine transporter
VTPASAAPPAPEKVKHPRTVLMAVAASLVEGYDTTLFGIYAVVIGRMFFPVASEAIGLLMAVGTFAAGYFMRPLGALLLGAYSDRLGRKRSVALVVITMSASTGFIGLLPTYEVIGIYASILVVLARLIQGFAAGGANSTAVVYIAELVPANRRALFVSFKHTSQVLAFLFSSLLGVVIFNMAPEAGSEWGWRVPFLLALLVGPVGLYIRYRSAETHAFEAEKAKASTGSPLREAFRSYKGRILLTCATGCFHTVSAFILLLFMPTFAVQQLKLPLGDALLATTVGAIAIMFTCPIGGLLADRYGVKRVMLVSSFLSILATIPAFLYLSTSPTALSFAIVLTSLGILSAPFAGVDWALRVELCPTRTRGTCMSISDSLNTLIFGGLGSILVTWMMTSGAGILAPAYYVTAAALISFASLFLVRPHMLHKFSA